MQTQTTDRVQAARASSVPQVVAYTGAAAFAIAAAWYGLAVNGVTVTPEPQPGTGLTADQATRLYYRWLATTFPQERIYLSVAILGFLSLAVTALLVRDLLGRDRTPTMVGILLVGVGAVTWIVGSVLELGGHHAVALMAAHANPIQTTNSIAFTIDTTSHAFALAGFALLGAGMLTLAGAALRARLRHHTEPGYGLAWPGCTVLIALLMLATAWSYAAGSSDVTDAMLLTLGALLPIWLTWAALTRGRHSASGSGAAPARAAAVR